MNPSQPAPPLAVFRAIVGAAFDAYNELGSGLSESIYEAILVHLLNVNGYAVAQQVNVPAYFRGALLHQHYRLDLMVENVIVELKACKFTTIDHRKQLFTYLKLTQNQFGILLNFSPNGVYSEWYQYNPERGTFVQLNAHH